MISNSGSKNIQPAVKPQTHSKGARATVASINLKETTLNKDASEMNGREILAVQGTVTFS
jgi:hypothetical protein